MTGSHPDEKFPGNSSPTVVADREGDCGHPMVAPRGDGLLGWVALGLSTASTVVYLATSHALLTYLEFLTGSVRKVLGASP